MNVTISLTRDERELIMGLLFKAANKASNDIDQYLALNPDIEFSSSEYWQRFNGFIVKAMNLINKIIEEGTYEV